MRDQPQAWSDRQEPATEGVPAQRPPAEEQPTGTGPDGAWAPPAERVAAGLPGAWMPAGAPADAVSTGQPYRESDEDRAAVDEDRADAEDRAAVDEDRDDDERAAVDEDRDDDERAAVDEDRDEEERAVDNEDRAVGVASVPDDGAVPGDAARDEAAQDEDEVRDDEVRHDAELHDAAHEVRDEPELVDNGDDDGGALYRSEADSDRDATEAGAADDATVEADEAAAAEADAPTDGAAAGGVPDDAVSSQDAPVPAAAYDATDAASDADVADSAAAGTEAGDATGTELMPGDVPQEPVSALFEAGTASDFRDRWQRVQMQFVDDPRAAADQARALVDDVVSALQEALSYQRGSLDSWQSGQAGDTEELRVAVRRYRDFLDRMLGL
jgi:hypothetical protein